MYLYIKVHVYILKIIELIYKIIGNSLAKNQLKDMRYVPIPIMPVYTYI